jgi:transcriptional regulator with XRE-family HTH domain
MPKTKTVSEAKIAKKRPSVSRRVDPSLGEKLRLFRERHHLSQQELASLLDSTWVSVSRWERAKSMPLPDVAVRAQRLLEIESQIAPAVMPGAFIDFLKTPHSMLRGFPPLDLLRSAFAFEHLKAFVQSALFGGMS